MYATNNFTWLDWSVVIGTLLISLLIGLYYMYKSKNSNEELLVGGRKMRVLPVAASVMVTYVSAITILGFPAEVYSFGAQIFISNIVSGIVFALSAYILIPFFYELKLTSVNEYLEKRFESKWVRWLASATFILQQITLCGVFLYAPSIALEAFLGLPIWISIVGIGVSGTIYTSVGGFKAVVITDAFQFLMMVAGMLAIVVKGIVSAGGFRNAFRIANETGRLNFIDLTFDPFMRHNLWNFIVGIGFHAMMSPAVHQQQVQRYSSMPSISNARKSIIYSVPLKLMVMVMCLLTGISIVAVYVNCDPFKRGEIKKVDQIVPYFVVNELSSIPGMIGLFTACIISAVLSSLSSSLNSLAAVTWEDFFQRMDCMKRLSPKAQANVSRVIGFIYGVLAMGLAFGAQNLGAIYSATHAAVGATGGALAGVFILGLFFPCANSVGASVGLLTGLISMCAISIAAFIGKRNLVPLPTSLDQCSPALNASLYETSFYNTTTTESPIHSEGHELAKIFRLSYLLYSVVASMITVLVGVTVSFIALLCFKSTRVLPNEKYLHPIAKYLYCFFPEKVGGGNRKHSQGEGTTESGMDSYIMQKMGKHLSVLQNVSQVQRNKNNQGVANYGFDDQ